MRFYSCSLYCRTLSQLFRAATVATLACLALLVSPVAEVFADPAIEAADTRSSVPNVELETEEPAPASEAEPASQTAQAELQEIKLKIGEREDSLLRLRESERAATVELERIKSEIAHLRSQRSSLLAEIKQVQGDLELAETELAVVERRHAEMLKIASDRLRAVYMAGHPSEFEFTVSALFKGGAKADSAVERAQSRRPISADRALYRRIRESDQKFLSDLATATKALGEQRAIFQNVIDQRAELEAKLRLQESTVATKESRQKLVLDSLRENQNKIRIQLNELRAQALRVETVIASLTGAEGTEVAELQEDSAGALPGAPARGGELRARMGKPAQAFTSPSADPAPLLGLVAQKGKLPFPLKSWLMVGEFGKVKKKELGVEVFNKGIMLKSVGDQMVRAVAPAKVVFSGRMPLFGTVVVLDHGDRYYSLYGKLRNSEVAAGQYVEQGALVGQLETSGEPELYLELRKEGKPLNPKEYLRRG